MNQDNETNNKAIEDKSFEELLEESYVDQKRFRPGEKIEAEVVKIAPDWIFIDLGGKSEGYLDRKELEDENGDLTIQEGDMIKAYFLYSKHNEKLFTTKIGKGDAGREHLSEAHKSGIPVEGFVEKEIKGGFEVKISGSIQAFCPYSQMGMSKNQHADEYIGQHIPFKIIEMDERGRRIVLSRRAILEEERKQRVEVLKEELHEGMTVKGTVTSLQKFGAFVDIGGVQGLIPISEIAWGRVDDVGEFLSVGQEIDVALIKLNWEENRITLSIRETLPDPWETVGERYKEGGRYHGRVSRLEKFGAFVTLEPGIDGLLHISRLGAGRRINHPNEILEKGQTVEIQVENIDREKKRLSLTMAFAAENEEKKEQMTEDYSQYAEQASVSLGTLGDLLRTKMKGKTK